MMTHSAPDVYLTIFDGEEQQAKGCCWLSLKPDGVGSDAYFFANSGTFLADFSLRMLEHDFVLRFDRPGEEFASHVTTVVHEREELGALMQVLSTDAWSDRLYPFSVWVLPQRHFMDATDLVVAFQYARGDMELFNSIIRLGGMRLAVWKSFLDLDVGCQLFEWSVDMVIRSAQSIPGALVWAGDTSTEFRARHPIPD